MTALLEVDNMSMTFPLAGSKKVVQAVNGVSFTLDRGETPRACHCCCSPAGIAAGPGKLAQATVLQSSASTPALFHPGLGQAWSSECRSGCAWARDVDTGP